MSADIMTEYDYRVEIVGNYWTLCTRVSVEFPDTIGNLSEEARELAETAADSAIKGELGISPLSFAHSCIVTLLLDGEEIAL
jgi:hypothetical protein